MDNRFLLDLCEKIELPPDARRAALRALSQYAPLLKKAVNLPEQKAIALCKHRLFRNRKSGAAFCLAFCLLRAGKAYALYKEKQIPDTVFYDTMRDITVWARTAKQSENIDGLIEIGWLRQSLYLHMFRVGRLQYQFGKIDFRALHIPPQSQKQIPFSQGDRVLFIHIPEDGKLDFDLCTSSVFAARTFFATYFPQYHFAGFACESWLLDENNRRFMRAGSNILRFFDLFDGVVETLPKNHELLRRLWHEKRASKRKTANLPENTDLQRRAKAYLLAGGTTHNGFGYLLK